MPTPFPGMDPYLERPGLWEEVHAGLIVSLQQFLVARVRPRYRVAVERRTYLELLSVPEAIAVGRPDVLVLAPPALGESAPGGSAARPSVTLAEVPMPDEVVERFLEVRDVETQEVITVVEILSPTNKVDFVGRRQYEQKRLRVLGSQTHLVEIDLLRSGPPMPLRSREPNAGLGTYRIVVSRSETRPVAEVYSFYLTDAIPTFPLPLRPGEPAPEVPLNDLVHELYDRAGYDLAVDYRSPPPPPLTPDELSWVSRLLGWKVS